jgi:PPM family protein phosphatase
MVLVAPKRERRTTRAERVMSGRVALFALVLVGILGGSAGAVGWYVQNSYFVGISGKEIVIYHGRPGGLLWFQPSVIEHTGISTSQIIPPVLPTLRAGVEEPTLQAAQQLVSKLTNDTSLLPLFSSTTTVPPSTVPSGISTTTTSSPVSSTSIVTGPTFPTASSTSIPSTTTTTTTPKSGTTTTTSTTTTTTPTTTTAPGHGKGHK